MLDKLWTDEPYDERMVGSVCWMIVDGWILVEPTNHNVSTNVLSHNKQGSCRWRNTCTEL